MSEVSNKPLIEWTSGRDTDTAELDSIADFSVDPDGRVTIAKRFSSDGEHMVKQLSADELSNLRAFVFEEQDVTAIDAKRLREQLKELEEAAGKNGNSPDLIELVMPPVFDASTTMIRSCVDGNEHRISIYNLVDKARRHPDIKELQRLRKIELYVLELIEKLTDTEK